MDSNEIQQILETRSVDRPAPEPSPMPDMEQILAASTPQTDPALLNTLKGVMDGLVLQQTRIAEAQERRAAAEERKAYALETQAENEMMKVSILREISTVLHNMSIKSSVASLMSKVKDTASFPRLEIESFSSDMGFSPDELENIPELVVDSKHPSPPRTIDDLEELYPEPETIDDKIPEEAIARFDEKAPPIPIEAHDTTDDIIDLSEPADIDDLSQLLEKDDHPATDIDDLSALLEPEDSNQNHDVDNLSALLEPEELKQSHDIDDLSALLEPEDLRQNQDIDDLSALLEPEDLRQNQDIDDLSLLIDDKPVAASPATTPPPGPKPSSVPPAPKNEAPPQKIDENYKSEILKRIIRMKQKQNMSVEETTRQFNEEGVKTFSGKGQWTTSTIAGIYKYIDSVSK
jgi:hypothetical protein